VKKLTISGSLLCVLLLSLAAAAAEPGQWKGLKLDVSTQAETVAILREPAERQENQKLRTPIDLFLAKDLRLQKLTFKGGEGFNRAELYFRDGRLRVIRVDLSAPVKASSFPTAYKLEFLPKPSGVMYALIGEAEASWVVASVSPTLGSLQDDAVAYPGEVRTLWLVSKSLRDTAGMDGLK